MTAEADVKDKLSHIAAARAEGVPHLISRILQASDSSICSCAGPAFNEQCVMWDECHTHSHAQVLAATMPLPCLNKQVSFAILESTFLRWEVEAFGTFDHFAHCAAWFCWQTSAKTKMP